MLRKALMAQAKVWGLGLGLMLTVCGDVTAASSTVYRMVDERGNVTFTDTPSGGGEALELAPLPGLPSEYAERSGEPPATSPGQPFMPYDRFQIRSPSAGTEVGADTPVMLSISPRLRDDHRVQLRVNGKLSQSALHSDVFWLANLPAGRHRLQAELLDSDGRRQHRTNMVTIVVAE